MKLKTIVVLGFLVFTGSVLAADDAPGAAMSVAPVPCEDPSAPLVFTDFSVGMDSVVWTSDGCTASLTCDSGCLRQCTGTTSCTVGSNYVECDGQQSTPCPTCNLSQYPGYPACGFRMCVWCTCVSNGWGTPETCCQS
jgi:hypothetical protein